MKFCTKCGKEILDDAFVCPSCGCLVNGNNAQSNTSAPRIAPGEKTGLATAALVCSFLVPIAGLICGIVGTIKYQTPSLKKRCTAAIFISIAVWIVTYLLLVS